MSRKRENHAPVILSPGHVLAAVLTVLVAGCTVGPDYVEPEVPMHDEWREEAAPQLRREPADLAGWWSRFGDPILDSLVERAVHGGLDVREALARVHEARALSGVARSDFFPTADAALRYERSRPSETTEFGKFAPLGDIDLWAVGFDAAWEIDLWGRVRRAVEAADAELEASVEDVRDVAVVVAAETAINYVTLRAFQRRVAIARNNVALQEETLAIVRARFETGVVGERDVAQAATNVETTRSRVPALEVGLRQAENRLAVLLGLTPGELAAELREARPIPVPPLEVAVGVPADLLRRRADVRRAERTLVAENARIGVAKADFYPRLALLGNIGYQAADAGDLFEHASGVYSIGPSIRWNIFDAGRVRRGVEAQDARAQQALVQWERAVLTALEETENAMTAFVREQVRRTSLLEATTQARRAVELAQFQYTEGLTDFQTVLDSQRTLADLDDDLAQSDSAIATNLVVLYKALGGGWEHMGEDAQAAAP